MSKSELHPEYLRQKALQEALLARKNHKSDWYNGIYDRWEHPVLTREHIPLEWRFDLDPAANPYFMERLGVNAVFNAGAIELDGKFYLVARVEGNDRKSFFAVAESSSPVDGFRFWDKPIELPDTCPEETNVYDMRLTKHEDGWIYGVFCSESKDTSNPDLSAAVAAAAILCTPDCTETAGSCWGFALVYSGNFLIEAQRADGGQRLVMGIHPYHFHWQLEPGGSFAAPEAAMVYSGQGLGEMSRRFHRAIRTRLLPPRWQDMHAPRPVLLNSWEACYFDFDQEKLLALAAAARQADIDLFVLDDGWFKGRSDTTSSLGDWTADRNKLPGRSDIQCTNRTNLADIPQLPTDWGTMVPVADETAAHLNEICQ